MRLLDVHGARSCAAEFVSTVGVGRPGLLVVTGVLLIVRVFDGAFRVWLLHALSPMAKRVNGSGWCGFNYGRRQPKDTELFCIFNVIDLLSAIYVIKSTRRCRLHVGRCSPVTHGLAN